MNAFGVYSCPEQNQGCPAAAPSAPEHPIVENQEDGAVRLPAPPYNHCMHQGRQHPARAGQSRRG